MPLRHSHLWKGKILPGENLTRLEAAHRAEIVQTHSYRVELDLRDSTTFRSRTTIDFSGKAGAATFVDLIAQSVEKIELNGTTISPSAFQNSRIELAEIAAENTLIVEATCLYSHTGEGLHRAVDPADGEVYLYSQFEAPDSRRMFAVFEQPNLKARFTFSVLAPAHWQVFSVSPTPEPQPVADGLARWEFSPTEPISSYLTCIIAGPYAGVQGTYTAPDGREIPLGVYARKSLQKYLDGAEVLEITKQGMPFYEEYFAQPYPFRKYDQIFVPEYNMGAMEHPGCVTILDDYVFQSKPTAALVERRAITILHELAHMWFGDLVTMEWWDDLWLNESFAEYMSHVATARATHWQEAWVTFQASEKSWARRQDQLPSTHPIAADIRDLEDVLVNFDGITYGKGASVFQQLVAYVGEEAFISGVRKYLAKKAWGNATLQDLLTELEAASGRDLQQWARLWLQEAGINTLSPQITETAGKIDEFAICQEKDKHASLRPHRIAVGGYNLEDGEYRQVAFTTLDISGARTVVPEFSGISRPDVLLINDGDLAYAKVRLDEESLTHIKAHINAFPPELQLTRALILFNVWDLCRDGLMNAADYADFALRALETETHGTVLRYTLSQLVTATNLYSPPQQREELQQRVSAKLQDILQSATPGSDRQLQLARTAIILAHSDADLDYFAGWLQEEKVPAGLEIDAALRWEILQRLAAAQRITEADIQQELQERDNTAAGASAAAEARAALATPEAKARAWEELLAGKIPNAQQRSLCLGFTAGDAKLLVPYVEKYFAEVERQWEERTVEFASNMITYTFPTKLTGRTDLGVDVIAAGQEWLDKHQDSAPALRRLVAEAVDGAERARRVQECSK